MNITVEVTTLDSEGNPIDKGCYKQIDPTGDEYMTKERKDRYEKLLGNGKAWISVPYIETQGGPGFSSVKAGVEIQIHCDQNSEVVREAADMLMADCLEIVDNHIYKAYDILLTHRDELNQKLEERGWSE
jgi:hypothetical protein